MAYRWQDKPDAPPHVCPFTRSGQADVGPFLNTGLAYLTPVQDENGEMRIVPRVNTLFISAQAIREMCKEPGSPIVTTTREEQARQEVILAERDDLARRVEELEAELDGMASSTAVVDVVALADALVVPLKSHFAMKPGPKTRPAA